MPAATPVSAARPPIRQRMMSCLGPQAFFQTPINSIGTGSGVTPSNVVHAVPFIPGLTSVSFRISVLPAFGRSAGTLGAAEATKDSTTQTTGAKDFIYRNLTALSGNFRLSTIMRCTNLDARSTTQGSRVGMVSDVSAGEDDPD